MLDIATVTRHNICSMSSNSKRLFSPCTSHLHQFKYFVELISLLSVVFKEGGEERAMEGLGTYCHGGGKKCSQLKGGVPVAGVVRLEEQCLQIAGQ